MGELGEVGLPDIAAGGEESEATVLGYGDEVGLFELTEVVGGGGGGDGEVGAGGAAVEGLGCGVDAAEHLVAGWVGEGFGDALELLGGEGRRGHRGN